MLKSISGLAAIRLAASIFGVLNALVLARLLGIERLGDYSVWLVSLNLAEVGVSLGFPTMLTARIAQGVLSRSMLRVVAVHVVVVGVMIAIGLLITSRYMAGDLAGLLQVYAAVPLVRGVHNLARAAVLGCGKIARAVICGELAAPIFMMVLIISFRPITVQAAAACLVASFAASACLGLVWMRGMAIVRGPRVAVVPFYQESATLALARYVRALQEAIPLMVTRWVGGADGARNAGALRIARRLVSLAELPLAAGVGWLSPKVAVAQLNSREFQQLLQRVARFNTAVMGVAVVGYIVLARPLIPIVLNSDYKAAWLPGLILLAGAAARSLFSYPPLILNLRGYASAVLRSQLVSLMATGLLLAAFVPSSGAVGAAAAISCGTLIFTTLTAQQCRRLIGVNTLLGASY